MLLPSSWMLIIFFFTNCLILINHHTIHWHFWLMSQRHILVWMSETILHSIEQNRTQQNRIAHALIQWRLTDTFRFAEKRFKKNFFFFFLKENNFEKFFENKNKKSSYKLRFVLFYIDLSNIVCTCHIIFIIFFFRFLVLVAVFIKHTKHWKKKKNEEE